MTSNDQSTLDTLRALAPAAFVRDYPAEHPLWARLLAHYSAPPRAYHNLSHLVEVAEHFAALGEQWQAPLSVYAAILFHDAVYEPLQADNEARSARLALAELDSAVRSGTIDGPALARLIELTAWHGRLVASKLGADEALFLDADMSILGAEPARYRAYAAGIAEEYALAPRVLYATHRLRFLRGLLEKPRLFLSDVFERKLAGRARDNLRWEVEQLAMVCEAGGVS